MGLMTLKGTILVFAINSIHSPINSKVNLILTLTRDRNYEKHVLQRLLAQHNNIQQMNNSFITCDRDDAVCFSLF